MKHISAAREADKVYGFELARQAVDSLFDKTWDELDPILAKVWLSNAHVIDWEEASTDVRQAWSTCLDNTARQLESDISADPPQDSAWQRRHR
jgi:hypothetical protein